MYKNPCPGGHDIYNFGRSFLGYHNYALGLYGLCSRVEKKIFQEIHQFYTFYSKITSPWDGGVMKFTISGLHPVHMLHQIFVS